jgi:hypothetical protein
MSKTIATVAVLCLSGLYAGSSAAAELFKAALSGDQEVPPVMTDTSGRAFLRLDNSETAIEIQLHVSDGLDITQSHIHCAPAGENGPIVVFLAGLHAAGLDVDGKWISNASFTSASIVNAACGADISELAESMRAGDTYVNVHSIDSPAGVVRGQISPTR